VLKDRGSAHLDTKSVPSFPSARPVIAPGRWVSARICDWPPRRGMLRTRDIVSAGRAPNCVSPTKTCCSFAVITADEAIPCASTVTIGGLGTTIGVGTGTQATPNVTPITNKTALERFQVIDEA
jgi:hypothetical protein